MSFDRALGDVEIASDFGIVTALEQEFDDLLFAGSHGSQRVVHFTFTSKPAPDAENGRIGKVRAQRVKQARWSQMQHARSHSRMAQVKKL
jgi:hypothetical protein